MNDIKIVLPDITIETESAFVLAREQVACSMRELKAFKDALDVAGMKYMKDNNISEIQVSDTARIYIGKDDKDRFDSEAIKKILGFTDEQVKVLPLNPAWKKSAILANEKTAPAFYVEPGEKIILKEYDKKFIK
jgi:hypothetical protein